MSPGHPRIRERLLGPSHPQSQLSIPTQGIPQTVFADAPVNTISQQDGPADDPTPSSGVECTAAGTALDSLSDVELDEEDVPAPGGEMLPDYILGQFELVRRTKNRWKCTLKHAVMHLNGCDVVVSKAQGQLTETEKCKPFGDHKGSLQT